MEFLETWGLWGLLLAVAFEDFIPIIPSTVLMIAYGTANGGIAGMPMWALFLLWFFPAVADSLLFALGYRKLHDVLEKPFFQRWISVDRLHAIERWFRRYGYPVIPVLGCFTGLRPVLALIAGISQIRFWHYFVLDSIGILIWIYWTLNIGTGVLGLFA